MRKIFVVLALVFMSFCAYSQVTFGDVVSLKTGEQLICKVVARSTDSLYVQYPNSNNTQSISLDRVANVMMSAQAVVNQPPVWFSDEHPSYYLKKCATQFTTALVFNAVGGFIVGASQTELGVLLGVGFELTGFILECCAVSSLSKSAKSLSRVSVSSNGVNITL